VKRGIEVIIVIYSIGMEYEEKNPAELRDSKIEWMEVEVEASYVSSICMCVRIMKT
jgi:hypothetical protein